MGEGEEARRHSSEYPCTRDAHDDEEHGSVPHASFVVDEVIEWWQDKHGAYWHRTAGIFVRNARREFLLFKRRRFPDGYTVPAGHVRLNEAPRIAAIRELREETSLHSSALEAITVTEMIGDVCRRGVDRHVWHSYLHRVSGAPSIEICDEGFYPVWLSLRDAMDLALIMPVRSLFASCEERLIA